MDLALDARGFWPPICNFHIQRKAKQFSHYQPTKIQLNFTQVNGSLWTTSNLRLQQCLQVTRMNFCGSSITLIKFIFILWNSNGKLSIPQQGLVLVNGDQFHKSRMFEFIFFTNARKQWVPIFCRPLPTRSIDHQKETTNRRAPI